MARDPLQTAGDSSAGDVSINPDDPTDMHGTDVSDPVLESDEITDLDRVPNPADYDEEMAAAHLVEAGLGNDVPGTDLHEVEQEGVTPIAKVSGNAVPDQAGGTDDKTAMLGLDTDDGEPDDPDAVIHDEEE